MDGSQIQFLGHDGINCYFVCYALLLIFGALLSTRPVATHLSDKCASLIVSLAVLTCLFDHSSNDPCEGHIGQFDQTVMQPLHDYVFPSLWFSVDLLDTHI